MQGRTPVRPRDCQLIYCGRTMVRTNIPAICNTLAYPGPEA